jgi:hypothetical protein
MRLIVPWYSRFYPIPIDAGGRGAGAERQESASGIMAMKYSRFIDSDFGAGLGRDMAAMDPDRFTF